MQKIWNRALWAMLALAGVVVVSAASFFAWMHHQYGGTSQTDVGYLKQHVVGTGLVGGNLQLALPPDLEGKRLIVLSEIHGSAAPQAIDLAFLKHLNQTSGIRNYAAEIDPAEAASFNHYLETGDEAGMRAVFDLWTPSAQWGNREFENKVRAIRDYNQNLASDRRIRFVGLDAVQSFPFVAGWISTITGQPFDQVRLKALEEHKRSEAAQEVLSWVGQRRAIHPEDQADLDALLFDMQQTAAAKGTRENAIFGNYSYQVRKGVIGDQPAYGMWGMFHGLQAQAAGMLPFAAKVRHSDLPAAKSIATIMCLGVDSGMMMPAGTLPSAIRPSIKTSMAMTFSADGPLLYLKGIGSLKEAAPAPHTVTVFRLDAAGSPYSKSLNLGPHWAAMGTIPFDQPHATSIDYIQYVALYRDSPAVVQRTLGE